MNYISALHKTFESCSTSFENVDNDRLLPISHTTAVAHIEVILDMRGNFMRARPLEKRDATTLIPCTEESGSRAGRKPTAHPLCDGLQYLAADYTRYGGEVTSGFVKDPAEPHRIYLGLLSDWVNFSKDARLKSILHYVEKGTLVADLISNSVIPVDEQGMFCKTVSSAFKKEYPIYSVLAAGQLPEDAFIRWDVEEPGKTRPAIQRDPSIAASWIQFYRTLNAKIGLCSVTGTEIPLAKMHPAKIRNAADRAKIISSNDTSGFTFRGRFIDSDQACGIGYEVTQKAHAALRWLIARQGYKNDEQVYVAWATSGNRIPQPFLSTIDLFANDQEVISEVSRELKLSDGTAFPIGDFGQTFALRLKKLIAGYQAELPNSENIVVMGLDSATPGRMAIIYYREISGTEFLHRIENWHLNFSWPLRFSEKNDSLGKKGRRTVWHACAPAPKEIADAAYGRRLDENLSKATVERIVPCIIDGRQLSFDLVDSTVRRASNRFSFKERWEWERVLGIACALYRGYFSRNPKSSEQRSYDMALEADRNSRDYLYGRLLAYAEHIEEKALYLAGENRETTASKLMQRFADRPYATWKTIEPALIPYKARLRSRWPGFLAKLNDQIDGIFSQFDPGDFERNAKLSGEYLLGYHCQRQVLRQPNRTESSDSSDDDNN